MVSKKKAFDPTILDKANEQDKERLIKNLRKRLAKLESAA
jgi:hypothetical protein